MDVVVAGAFHDDQFDRRAGQRGEPLAVRERNAAILAAVEQDDRHLHVA